MTAHENRAHAKLSPSSAERWMACPGSVRMSEGIADTSSVYADEGTAAHELAERCLRDNTDPHDYLGDEIEVKGNPYTVDEEMADAITVYVELCRDLMRNADVFALETRFDLTHIAEGMFGTGDFTALVGGVLHVVDLKYGRGKSVEVDENPQLMLYGLGALRRYHNHGVNEIELIVVQPRAAHPGGPVRRYRLDALDLMMRQAEIVAAALATQEPDAPLAPGPWCGFCRAAAICPAHQAEALALVQAEFEAGGFITAPEPQHMTPAQLGERLQHVDFIERWCRRVRDHAHAEAMDGRMPEGFKLVAKRATRRWKSEDAAKEAMLGLAIEPYTQKIKTPAQAEKNWPGKNKGERAAAMAELVTKESSGAVLAEVSDPRPAWSPADVGGEFASTNYGDN